jgi:hypothetical protein
MAENPKCDWANREFDSATATLTVPISGLETWPEAYLERLSEQARLAPPQVGSIRPTELHNKPAIEIVNPGEEEELRGWLEYLV